MDGRFFSPPLATPFALPAGRDRCTSPRKPSLMILCATAASPIQHSQPSPSAVRPRQPPLTCCVASTVWYAVPLKLVISGSGGLSRVQWYSTPSVTTVQSGCVPWKMKPPATIERETSSLPSSAAAMAPPPGRMIASAAAVDADAGGGQGRVEPCRHTVVVEVVDDAKLDRLALTGGQLGAGFVDALEPGLVWLQRAAPVDPVEQSEALASALLEPPTADGIEEDVTRDREEPRAGRAAGFVLEARAREPRLCECLGRQVVRRVVVAAAGQVERVHAVAYHS
jgi:hypothetical protein